MSTDNILIFLTLCASSVINAYPAFSPPVEQLPIDEQPSRRHHARKASTKTNSKSKFGGLSAPYAENYLSENHSKLTRRNYLEKRVGLYARHHATQKTTSDPIATTFDYSDPEYEDILEDQSRRYFYPVRGTNIQLEFMCPDNSVMSRIRVYERKWVNFRRRRHFRMMVDMMDRIGKILDSYCYHLRSIEV